MSALDHEIRLLALGKLPDRMHRALADTRRLVAIDIYAAAVVTSERSGANAASLCLGEPRALSECYRASAMTLAWSRRLVLRQTAEMPKQ